MHESNGFTYQPLLFVFNRNRFGYMLSSEVVKLARWQGGKLKIFLEFKVGAFRHHQCVPF
jgi:hypothetical protein